MQLYLSFILFIALLQFIVSDVIDADDSNLSDILDGSTNVLGNILLLNFFIKSQFFILILYS